MQSIKIVNQHANSEKYGKCELCGKHVSEMHTAYFDTNRSLWGHKECLSALIDCHDGKISLEEYLKIRTTLS